MGTDLKSAAVQVGTALNDPILGVSALARSGIQFSEDQKKMIKSLVDTGKHAEAQRVILKELESQFGGAAKAGAQGLGGALSQLGNAFGDMLETLAKITIGEGVGFIRWLTNAVNYINKTVLPAFSFFIEQLGIMKRSVESLTEEETQVRLAALAEELNEVATRMNKTTDPSMISTYRDQITKLSKEYADLTGHLDKHIEKQKEINDTKNVTGDEKRTVKLLDDESMLSQLQARMDVLNTSFLSEQEAIALSEENKHWILEDAYQNQLISFQAFQDKKTEVERESSAQRMAIAQRHNDVILNMQMNNGQQLVGLLRAFAGENKAAAIAAIVIEKGLAIARIQMSTETAAARALAELGYVAGTAAAASIRTQGAISMGLVAATGLAEVSQVGSGGAAQGTAANPVNVNQVPSFDSAESRERGTAIVNIYGAVTEDMVRDVIVPVIQKDIEDYDLTLFSSTSRQANI